MYFIEFDLHEMMDILYMSISDITSFYLREIFDHVRDLISKHSSDCWWNMSVEELLPQEILSRVRIPLTIHVVVQYIVN